MKNYFLQKRIYSLLVIVSLFPSCKGQDKTHPGKIADEQKTITSGQPKIIKWRDISIYNGVDCGLQDRTGNLWFGATGQGVYHYEGKSFTNYTEKEGLNSNNITSILEDKTGNIWFGTDAGLCHYDGKAFTIVPISASNANTIYPGTTSTANPSATNAVWSILQDKSGKLWFGTSDGVYCYNGTSFTHFLDNDGVINKNGLHLKMVQCMIEDNNGNIWFASGLGGREGICRYDGKEITGFKPGGEGNVRKILEDKNGTIWMAYQNSGIFYYDGKTFTNFKVPARLIEHTCNTMMEDKSGNIWFGLDYRGDNISDTSGGVWRYNPSALNTIGSNAFTNFTSKDGLSNNSVDCIIEDKAGNLWFGTRNIGLCRYDGKTFTHFSE